MHHEPRSDDTNPGFDMSPDSPLADTPLRIVLRSLSAHAEVTLRATMPAGGGQHWESWATFDTGESGTIDLATATPLDGTYRSPDPMGFVWSMALVPGALSTAVTPDAPPPITLQLEHDGRTLAEREIVRAWATPDIHRVDVRENGLVGVLFEPRDGAPRPAILLLGGSEGGLHAPDAALLASHGFTVLALAYFRMPPLPDTLIDIPLEYFGTAIRWLSARPTVTADRIGVIGGSRGGELALLLGATFPEIRTVVSYLGSGIIIEGIGSGAFLEMVSPHRASWTYRGDPLPYMPMTVTPEFEARVHAGEPIELRDVFLGGLEDESAVEHATIPVEHTAGPILLISAGDDRGWPSERLSQVAMERLQTYAHPHAYRHLRYPGAGHGIIPPPYGPTTMLEAPGPGVRFRSGGTPQANAAARAHAWAQAVAFLQEHLGAEEPSPQG
jgi:dienelactone hydrolase